MKNRGQSQWKLENREIKEKGITLIALVVTIIILLILAGVAINLSVGDNGLFHKAQEAVNTYKLAEQKESQDLGVLENELEKAKVDWSKVYDNTGYAPDNTPIITTEGTYYIPAGFKLANDSAGKISDGIVVEDKNGNQWVWVPCYVEGGKVTDRINPVKYDRYPFNNQVYGKINEEGGDTLENEDHSKIYENSTSSTYYYEKNPLTEESNEYKSILKYGGLYIGRYEAGDKEMTEAKKMRGDTSYNDTIIKDSSDTTDYSKDQTHIATIKNNQVPYNWISYNKSVELSEGFATANDYSTDKMYTKLCNGYAWDTILKFIETRKSAYETYGSTSIQNGKVYENCENVAFNYSDINGDIQTKNVGEITIIPTGQIKGICNIYDLGGNLGERVTESVSNSVYHYGVRGGVFQTNSRTLSRFSILLL